MRRRRLDRIAPQVPSRRPPAARSTQGGLNRLGVHQLIESMARQRPESLAIWNGDRELTYGELDRLATRLARRLGKLGVRSGDLVGLQAAPTWRTVVGMLGALKAGAAYVPIDERQPEARTDTILGECRATCVLGQASSEWLPSEWRSKFVALDDLESSNADERNTSFPIISGAQLAYVIYTSGSTGAPNGVCVTHDNVVHSTRARLSYYARPVGRFLLLSPMTFDSSVAGIYWTLSSGGALVLPHPHPEERLAHLDEEIAEREVTHVLCIPSLWKSVLSKPNKEGWQRSLRVTILAGETCTVDVVGSHYDRCPDVGLFNEYGPTEATVWSTVQRVERKASDTFVPIGRAIPNMRAYVLDSQLQPVANGDTGELCVAGPGVSAGYLDRPELQTARFVANPHDGGKFARMYRTGDLVSRLEDGALRFHGRVDNQLKIRGQRMEPEEIESALQSHDGVREAAVAARDGSLVAYCVLANGALDAAVLGEHLSATLPPYMTPSRWYSVKSLPRTSHGKIDRGSLASLEVSDIQAPQPVATLRDRIDPRDNFEFSLVRMWEALLGRSGIGVEDDFFRLGGDSLMAVELAAQVQRSIHRDFTPRDIAENTTIAKMARLLREGKTASEWSPLVSLQPLGWRRPLFCIHPGGGNVLCYLELSRALGEDQPLYGIQAPGVDGVREPLTRVEQMASEYIGAMKAVQPEGPYSVLGWSFGGIVAYEIARQLRARGDGMDLVALVDAGILYSVLVIRQLFPSPDVPLFHLRGYDSERLLPDFVEKASAAEIIPPGATDEQAKWVLDVFRANVDATIHYNADPYDGEVVLLLGADPPPSRKADPEREWRRLCAGVTVERTAAEHLTILKPPHTNDLAAALQRHMCGG